MHLYTCTPYMSSPPSPYMLLPSRLPGMSTLSMQLLPILLCYYTSLIQKVFPDPEVTSLPSGSPQGFLVFSSLANNHQWCYLLPLSKSVFSLWARACPVHLSTPEGIKTSAKPLFLTCSLGRRRTPGGGPRARMTPGRGCG